VKKLYTPADVNKCMLSECMLTGPSNRHIEWTDGSGRGRGTRGVRGR